MSTPVNPAIIIALAYAILLPLGLLIWWKAKTGAKLWCFIAGAICFTLFAYLLEALMHQAILTANNPLGARILASPILYMLYGSFAAGIFEETGRLFGYKVLLKKRHEKESAIAYGIGHGGIEVILILGMTYIAYLIASLGGDLGGADTTAQILGVANSITIPVALVGMFERISAMMLHIGLSMLMFVATKAKGKMWLYPVCICIHALADAPACLYQYQVITSLFVIEVLAFVMGIIILIIGNKKLAAATTEIPE